MARCAVPARVQRAERMLDEMRITVFTAPLNTARTAQRAIQPVVVSRYVRQQQRANRLCVLFPPDLSEAALHGKNDFSRVAL